MSEIENEKPSWVEFRRKRTELSNPTLNKKRKDRNAHQKRGRPSADGRFGQPIIQWPKSKRKSVPYAKYLESQYWKKLRKAMIIKYRNCQICTSDHVLHVHHHRYKDKNGSVILYRETYDDVVLLCCDCHKELHRLDLQSEYFRSTTRRSAKEQILRSLNRIVIPEVDLPWDLH